MRAQSRMASTMAKYIAGQLITMEELVQRVRSSRRDAPALTDAQWDELTSTLSDGLSDEPEETKR